MVQGNIDLKSEFQRPAGMEGAGRRCQRARKGSRERRGWGTGNGWKGTGGGRQQGEACGSGLGGGRLFWMIPPPLPPKDPGPPTPRDPCRTLMQPGGEGRWKRCRGGGQRGRGIPRGTIDESVKGRRGSGGLTGRKGSAGILGWTPPPASLGCCWPQQRPFEEDGGDGLWRGRGSGATRTAGRLLRSPPGEGGRDGGDDRVVENGRGVIPLPHLETSHPIPFDKQTFEARCARIHTSSNKPQRKKKCGKMKKNEK